jgi:hypothetical protein
MYVKSKTKKADPTQARGICDFSNPALGGFHPRLGAALTQR